ncbi:DUF1631 domain-containing protein [Ramlibacter sp. XY19]|uniref:DUF1631 family protein n=1 Tax=Ramlibacter paludis TaxID=2908000 RepID=UPI0023DCBFDC|nr:DUF1631 family protein [Ramlibacter paludis]MCG2594792.1 DUF1631 domain-containing protein [Ramlibacter paludis]
MSSTLTPAATPLARQARERFVAHMEGVLPELCEAIRNALSEQMSNAPSSRDMQQRRDALVDFEREAAKWAESAARAWRRAVIPATATGRVRMQLASLELIGNDVVENKILSSRLAMAVTEKAVWDLNDLKLRVTHLEGGEELATEDVLRPEALSQLLVEQWMGCKLGRETWTAVKDVIQASIVPRAVQAYQLANEFLVDRGVMPEIDLSSHVKRPPQSPARPQASAGGAASTGFGGGYGGGNTNFGAPGGPSGHTDVGGGYGPGSHGGGGGGWQGESGAGQGGAGGGGGYGGGGGGGNGYGASTGNGQAPGTPGTAGGGGGARGMNGASTSGGPASAVGTPTGRSGMADGESRMMTGTTPLARAKARATGVLGQLRRLLSERVAGFEAQQGGGQPSPGLMEAVTAHATQVQTQVQTRVADGQQSGDIVIFDDAAVAQVALDLRSRTQDLKHKAATSNEKATIEIVALMFQSILAEERIPAAVRVWFARLQMPVLRVALAEPEFFGSLEHPARQLIDRMGSCVLGFDSAAISGSEMEVEIKRIVQVIEQYPETGRRVFQLVYDEFQKFLSRFLTQKGPTQKLVSVAQQVEQKETMAIQYTIELRKMLSDVPVREEIREFLFKVWAEVLAVAAVKNGPQNEETLALKKSASDLVWAASAKPNRNDRAKVIQELPDLLARLRRGMTLLGVQAGDQETHIKVIGDTLADAFMSKTEAIPHARIEEMTRRLANLEDFVSEDDAGELPLDQESIEMMLGIDASMIEVISTGGSQPTGAMMGWANELQLGTWFTLDHNGAMRQVQYAWASDRRQLHLFAASDGHCYLMPVRRLAAYLQASLLVPTEEEALTVRATRDALAKLDANPERLLQ